MKKTITILALLLACILILAGCQSSCEHQWTAADCSTPKTCSVCEATEGAPLGHTWKAATCITPKTCETCGKKDGKALEHTWEEATCTAPKTCSACKVTSGDALGHKWLDATTETPKSCEICHITEGERIITDPRFKTADSKILFGKWTLREEITAELLGLPASDDKTAVITVYELLNDGTIKIYCEIEDRDMYAKLVKAVALQTLLADGTTEEEADQLIRQAYNMSLDEYVKQEADRAIATVESMSFQGVYYVSDGFCYSGLTWDTELEREEIVLDGDTLKLVDKDGDNVTLTRS